MIHTRTEKPRVPLSLLDRGRGNENCGRDEERDKNFWKRGLVVHLLICVERLDLNKSLGLHSVYTAPFCSTLRIIAYLNCAAPIYRRIGRKQSTSRETQVENLYRQI